MPQMTTGPTTAPMLAVPTTSVAESVRAQLAAEGRPEPDDIPEPQRPDAVDMFMASAIASSVAHDMPLEASRMPQEATSPPSPTPAWAEHEALLQGFCGVLQGKIERMAVEHFRESNKALEDLMSYMKGWTEGVLNKLVADTQAARLNGYGVTIQAMSPNGYPLTMTITKATKEEVRAELIDTAIWLAENGCKMLS